MVAEGGAKLHFVDDRFQTVKAIAANAHLSAMPNFQTYFATWYAAVCRLLRRVVATGQRDRDRVGGS